jgi:hypothetical protein
MFGSALSGLINTDWLGAATSKNYATAVPARADLLNPANAVRLPYTAFPTRPNRAHGIDYGNAIHQIETATQLNREQPDRLLNVACDCGSEFAPIVYLLSRYRDSMTVFWFDAHARGVSHAGWFHRTLVQTVQRDARRQYAEVAARGSILLRAARITDSICILLISNTRGRSRRRFWA